MNEKEVKISVQKSTEAFIQQVNEDYSTVPKEITLEADLQLEEDIIEENELGQVNYSLTTLPRPSGLVPYYRSSDRTSSPIGEITDRLPDPISEIVDD
ncbi:MAG: hypothetical protein ABEI86_05680, partial [Halobacteriaceae archaeon]